jgi:iron complex transport system substrate-binding protein
LSLRAKRSNLVAKNVKNFEIAAPASVVLGRLVKNAPRNDNTRVYQQNDRISVEHHYLFHNTMNKRIVMVFLALLLSCTATASEPVSVSRRIVSLSPATTEILFSLGLGDRIVGVTSFCDYPPEAKKKAKIGGMSNPSLESIFELKPDIVVMTTDGNPREVDDRLQAMSLKTYVWTSRTLADLPRGIRDLAVAMGVKERGEKLAREMEEGIEKYRSKKSGVGSQKKVVYIVWPEPLLVAGPSTAIHDAIILLGLENVAGHAPSSYPRYSIEELIRSSPDVVVIGKGVGMDIHVVSVGVLKKLASVPAVKNGKVCYVSDNLYRLAPRVIQGIEELAACVQ